MFKQIADTYKRSFSGLSRETWLLSAVILVNRCGYMAVPFMGLYVTQHLHRSAAETGLLISIFGLGSIAGAATGGFMTDRIGYRPVQIITSLVSGSLFFVFAGITHFSTLCVLSFIISFFTEAFRPANFTATAAYAKPGTQTRSYSLNRLAMNLGWAVGTSMGGLLAAIDYRLLFIVDGSVNIIGGCAILLLLPTAARNISASDEKKQRRISRRPWHDRIFMNFLMNTTLFAICFFLMFRIAPLFFKEKWNMSESKIGLLLALNGILIALFEMVLIAHLDKTGRKLRFAVLGAVSVAVSYLFLTLPSGVAVAASIASMVLFTIGEMLALPFINSFVISRTDEFNRGQYAAGYTLCWSVSQVVGPASGLYIGEKFGYAWLWTIICMLMLACATGYHLLNRKIKNELLIPET